jgi:hypothetical protein
MGYRSFPSTCAGFSLQRGPKSDHRLGRLLRRHLGEEKLCHLGYWRDTVKPLLEGREAL